MDGGSWHFAGDRNQDHPQEKEMQKSKMSRTSIHSSQALCLSDLIPWICLSLPLYNCKGFDLGRTWMVWWYSRFFNLSLNLSMRSSWSEPQSSWSCFCWLYIASPCLAAKNIINLILVLTICWCPCVEYSLVLLEESVCYDLCVFLAKLLAFACFILSSKAKCSCYSKYLLDLCHQWHLL